MHRSTREASFMLNKRRTSKTTCFREELLKCRRTRKKVLKQNGQETENANIQHTHKEQQACERRQKGGSVFCVFHHYSQKRRVSTNQRTQTREKLLKERLKGQRRSKERMSRNSLEMMTRRRNKRSYTLYCIK